MCSASSFTYDYEYYYATTKAATITTTATTYCYYYYSYYYYYYYYNYYYYYSASTTTSTTTAILQLSCLDTLCIQQMIYTSAKARTQLHAHSCWHTDQRSHHQGGRSRSRGTPTAEREFNTNPAESNPSGHKEDNRRGHRGGGHREGHRVGQRGEEVWSLCSLRRKDKGRTTCRTRRR